MAWLLTANFTADMQFPIVSERQYNLTHKRRKNQKIAHNTLSQLHSSLTIQHDNESWITNNLMRMYWPCIVLADTSTAQLKTIEETLEYTEYGV